MLCLGILWNGMENYTDDAIYDVSLYGDVLDAFSLKLDEKYENFVRDIYAQDDIAKWKVDKKIETMFNCTNGRAVTILIMNIKTDERVYHENKKRMVFVNLENMKVAMRAKYSKLVNEYFFDNVFHVTDDENEYNADLNVVNNYVNMGLECKKILEEEKCKVLKKEKDK